VPSTSLVKLSRNVSDGLVYKNLIITNHIPRMATAVDANILFCSDNVTNVFDHATKVLDYSVNEVQVEVNFNLAEISLIIR
jgi:hypothetical protein